MVMSRRRHRRRRRRPWVRARTFSDFSSENENLRFVSAVWAFFDPFRADCVIFRCASFLQKINSLQKSKKKTGRALSGRALSGRALSGTTLSGTTLSGTLVKSCKIQDLENRVSLFKNISVRGTQHS